MLSSDSIAMAAVVATLVGSVGVIGQIVVTRRQVNLQEATNYRDQAQAWRTLSEQWSILIAVGFGPEFSRMAGLNKNICEDYEKVLSDYRDARIAWHQDISNYEQTAAEVDDTGYPQEPQLRLDLAEAALEPYKAAIKEILVHLAQLSDLVLRRRLSAAALYDAVGHDVIRNKYALTRILHQPYDSGDCPGPVHHEIEGWKSLSLDDISERIGWVSVLSGAGGAASRIRALIDVMVLHGHVSGDEIWSGPESLADSVIDAVNLGRRWKTISRLSKVTAVSFCWMASAIEYEKYYENPIVRVLAILMHKIMRPVRFVRVLGVAVSTKDEADEIRLSPLYLPEALEDERLAAA